MTLIKKPSEPIAPPPIRVLIYGQPGIRKTTWSLTAPRPLLLDFDSGIHRVRPQDRRDFVPVNSWDDAINVLNEDLSDYDTIIVDTAGKALDFLATSIIKETPKMGYQGDLSLKGFGVLKTKFRSWLRQVEALKKSVVFVAHERETSEGDQKIVRPDAVGSSLNILVREMDLVGYVEAVNNKPTARFTPTDKSYGKNTLGLPDSIDISSTTLADIFSETERRREEQQRLRGQYDELIGDISMMCDGIDGVETAEEIRVKLGELPAIWDSKFQAAAIWSARLASLGISFDNKSKKYTK